MKADQQKNLNADTWPVLLVDDEADLLFTTRLVLEKAGLNPIETLSDSRDVMHFLEQVQGQVAVVVLDLYMPNISGKMLLEQIRKLYPEIPVIIMTAAQQVENAVVCMKMGALDYLVKPVEVNRLVSSVARHVELTRLKSSVTSLKNALLEGQLQRPEMFADLIFCSPRMSATMQYLETIAQSREPVLLLGETGVGKGLAARILHCLGDFKVPLVTVNVGGLDDNVFSDTLFGHIKGAFTGADGHRNGMIAMAKGSILFLDEIGDLSELSQIKLLQLLEEGTYSPLGNDSTYSCDARIVCATNRDLAVLVKKGLFRSDLYYRLKVHQVRIPSLRERREDIEPLTRHFLDKLAKSHGKPTPTPPSELFTLLATYHFPGNVRELRAMVNEAVVRHKKGVLSLAVFREFMGDQTLDPSGDTPGLSGESKLAILGEFPTLDEAKLFLIQEALRRAHGNQGIAASMLGISRRALNGRLSRLHPDSD
ncbi:MAG: sigma-54-dependent Fis family transcriptional regulator [Magnetococcales bacterium]|nr:sigma-54-dependent Fis family transcriptional regulator [Magnetococcales bacterium]